MIVFTAFYMIYCNIIIEIIVINLRVDLNDDDIINDTYKLCLIVVEGVNTILGFIYPL